RPVNEENQRPVNEENQRPVNEENQRPVNERGGSEGNGTQRNGTQSPTRGGAPSSNDGTQNPNRTPNQNQNDPQPGSRTPEPTKPGGNNNPNKSTGQRGEGDESELKNGPNGPGGNGSGSSGVLDENPTRPTDTQAGEPDQHSIDTVSRPTEVNNKGPPESGTASDTAPAAGQGEAGPTSAHPGEIERVGNFRDKLAAFKHYAKHVRGVVLGAKGKAKAVTPDLPEFNSFGEYLAAARAFMGGGASEGTLEGIRPGGDLVRLDPKSGYFGSRGPDGVIRTFFRPDGGPADWLKYYREQFEPPGSSTGAGTPAGVNPAGTGTGGSVRPTPPVIDHVGPAFGQFRAAGGRGFPTVEDVAATISQRIGRTVSPQEVWDAVQADPKARFDVVEGHVVPRVGGGAVDEMPEDWAANRRMDPLPERPAAPSDAAPSESAPSDSAGPRADAAGALERVGDFQDKQAALEHFAKHVKGVDLGADGSAKAVTPDVPEFRTFSEYLAAARAFMGGGAREGTIEGIRRGGDLVRLDPKSGYFGTRGPDGVIRTFFRPEGGREEWLQYFGEQFTKATTTARPGGTKTQTRPTPPPSRTPSTKVIDHVGPAFGEARKAGVKIPTLEDVAATISQRMGRTVGPQEVWDAVQADPKARFDV
ncbi:MAG TPA: hypothetical protein VH092_24440, partial [Urbifossiella sp.]|nr:hypothetical protein [Urbifossiella sp.]